MRDDVKEIIRLLKSPEKWVFNDYNAVHRGAGLHLWIHCGWLDIRTTDGSAFHCPPFSLLDRWRLSIAIGEAQSAQESARLAKIIAELKEVK